MLGRVGWSAVSLLLVVAACSGGGASTAGSGGAPGSGGLAGAAGSDAGGPDASADAGPPDAAACPDKADVSFGGPASADPLYPTPRYASLAELGARVTSFCLDSSVLAEHSTVDALAPKLFAGLTPAALSCDCDFTLRFQATAPALTGQAATSWADAGQNPERYVVVSSSQGGRATSAIFAPNERAALHALYSVAALVQPDGTTSRVANATLVDYPALGARAVLEGFYGSPYTSADRASVIRLAARLKQSAYVYGPKNDAYAREKWAEPYPAAEAQALADAAKVAREHLVDFVWSVSPGLPFAAIPPGSSIKYSSASDFQKLCDKIESVRALGVTHFALFLDDLTGFLVWPEDAAAFPSLVDAHAALMNQLDAYLKAKDPAHRLLVVGSEYTSFWLTWDAYNTELGKLLAPDIDVMWTGPEVYSSSIQASDLVAIDGKLGRKVVLWDNGPQTVAPLTGRAADLPDAIAGIYSNAVINELGAHPTSDFFEVQGTLADWAWNPAAYEPSSSFARWQQLLAPAP